MNTSKTINAYAVSEAGGQFEPFSYEVGELQPNEVEIDVLNCGICHSDLSMVDKPTTTRPTSHIKTKQISDKQTPGVIYIFLANSAQHTNPIPHCNPSDFA